MDIYMPALMPVLSDLTTRFDDHILSIVRQINSDFFHRFPPQQASGHRSTYKDIFCNKCNFDVDFVARDLTLFMLNDRYNNRCAGKPRDNLHHVSLFCFTDLAQFASLSFKLNLRAATVNCLYM